MPKNYEGLPFTWKSESFVLKGNKKRLSDNAPKIEGANLPHTFKALVLSFCFFSLKKNDYVQSPKA
jgi:hypothetical protein